MIKPIKYRVVEFKTAEGRKYCLSLSFENSYEMNMTMVRLQEFYESPEFANKYFTLEEYMDWYAYNEHDSGKKITFKGFDYLTRVVGTNIPGNYIKEFRTLFTDLSKRERLLFDIVDSFNVNFSYIISSFTNPEQFEDLQHELAHARYDFDKDYARTVELIVLKYFTSSFNNAIIKRGYSESNVIDEMHAFALTGMPKWYPFYRRNISTWLMMWKLRRIVKKLPNNCSFGDELTAYESSFKNKRS